MHKGNFQLSWSESYTGRFNIQELYEIHNDTPEIIIEKLKATEPENSVVVLRLLAEILGHKDFEKFYAVAKDPEIKKVWQGELVSEYSEDAAHLTVVTAIFEALERKE